MSGNERAKSIISKFYPEVDAGGFTRVDGTVEFYTRISALIKETDTVLDFGAGRAAWYENGASQRNNIRLLKGKVQKVIACDVDPAVKENRAADESFVIDPEKPLDLPDASVDVLIADMVLEHIQDASFWASEFSRVVKAGGWICCRTPNKNGYISVATRLVPNDLHVKVLQYAQPNKKARDTFPTRFQLNTMATIRKHFDAASWDDYSYYYQAEPAYHFNNTLLFGAFKLLDSMLPRFLYSNLFVFLQKR